MMSHKIFIPQYCSDMTEGRGGMVDCKFGFISRGDAADYIDTQPGIMGRTAKWSNGELGDWDIKEIDVYGSIYEMQHAEKEKNRINALKALDESQAAALGLLSDWLKVKGIKS